MKKISYPLKVDVGLFAKKDYKKEALYGLPNLKNFVINIEKKTDLMIA